MQGITPDPAVFLGMTHTLFIMYRLYATLIGTRINLFMVERGRLDGPFDPAVARNSELLGSNRGRVRR